MSYKATIVFHSVCGNTYLLAKCYEKALKEQGVEVSLYRVEDPNREKIAEIFKPASHYSEEIVSVPVITDVSELVNSDMLFIGSPTYIGSMSGPIKMFMDGFIDLWENSPLNTCYCGAFVTYSTPYGGSSSCLKSINTFAQHLGAPVFPVKSNIGPVIQPPYGIVHHSGEDVLNRPGDDIQQTVSNYIRDCIDLLSR